MTYLLHCGTFNVKYSNTEMKLGNRDKRKQAGQHLQRCMHLRVALHRGWYSRASVGDTSPTASYPKCTASPSCSVKSLPTGTNTVTEPRQWARCVNFFTRSSLYGSLLPPSVFHFHIGSFSVLTAQASLIWCAWMLRKWFLYFCILSYCQLSARAPWNRAAG